MSSILHEGENGSVFEKCWNDTELNISEMKQFERGQMTSFGQLY